MEYIQKGLPASDREWSSPEAERAMKALTALAADDPRQLPHFESARSGIVFARMVNPDNLALSRDQSLPLSARLTDAMNSLQATNQILKLYLREVVAGSSIYARDLIELVGYQLHVVVELTSLADEMALTIPKDDPNYDARMKGFDQMRSGLATMVSGSLLTLTERAVYSKADRVALMGHLKRTLPSIMPRLTEASRLDLQARVRELAEDQSNDLHPAIDELKASIEQR